MSCNARNYQAQHVNTAGLRNPGGQVGGSTWPPSGITSWVNGNKSNDKIYHPTQCGIRLALQTPSLQLMSPVNPMAL